MDIKECNVWLKTLSTVPSGSLTVLLDAAGVSEQQLRCLCVTGAEGKSSRAAAVSEILRAAGLHIGLLLTHYFYQYSDCIVTDGTKTDSEAFSSAVTAVKAAADREKLQPALQEVLLAAALLCFRATGCSVAVLALPRPFADEFPAPYLCSDRSAPVGEAPEVVFDSPEGQVFNYAGGTYAIPLLGMHQVANAAAALDIINELQIKHGWEIDASAIEHGLYAVTLPARFEPVDDSPVFLSDCGNTPAAAEAIAACLKQYYPEQKHVVLLADADPACAVSMAEALLSAADEFVVCSASPEVADAITAAGKPVTACDGAEQAAATAQDIAEELGGIVCSLGSDAAVADIRLCFSLT